MPVIGQFKAGLLYLYSLSGLSSGFIRVLNSSLSVILLQNRKKVDIIASGISNIKLCYKPVEESL